MCPALARQAFITIMVINNALGSRTTTLSLCHSLLIMQLSSPAPDLKAEKQIVSLDRKSGTAALQTECRALSHCGQSNNHPPHMPAFA